MNIYTGGLLSSFTLKFARFFISAKMKKFFGSADCILD